MDISDMFQSQIFFLVLSVQFTVFPFDISQRSSTKGTWEKSARRSVASMGQDTGAWPRRLPSFGRGESSAAGK